VQTRLIVQDIDKRCRVDNPDFAICFKTLKCFIAGHYKIGLGFNGAGNYLIIARVRRNTGKDNLIGSATRLKGNCQYESVYIRFRQLISLLNPRKIQNPIYFIDYLRRCNEYKLLISPAFFNLSWIAQR